MERCLVVISDDAGHDRGLKGSQLYWWLSTQIGAYAELGLFWFLRTYLGSGRVELIRPEQLLVGGRRWETDWLFVGLPTRVGREHLAKIRFNKMALYDSSDRHVPEFGYSDRGWLLSQTDLVLKTWRDRHQSFGYRIGLLPIKRPPINNKLKWAVTLHDQLGKPKGTRSLRYDICLVARPTGEVKNNPRVRWLVDIVRERPELRLFGGLIGTPAMREVVTAQCGLQIPDRCWMNHRKTGFGAYYRGLCRSRVALAPPGYAPWSYRHFEALYGGAIPVCQDMSNLDFLIPFPAEGMAAIRPGGSVVDAVDRALELSEQGSQVAAANRRWLDRWLVRGGYSRRCPATFERFLAELGRP